MPKLFCKQLLLLEKYECETNFMSFSASCARSVARRSCRALPLLAARSTCRCLTKHIQLNACPWSCYKWLRNLAICSGNANKTLFSSSCYCHCCTYVLHDNCIYGIWDATFLLGGLSDVMHVISKGRAHEWHIVWSLAETTGTHRTTHCTVMDNCNVCKP